MIKTRLTQDEIFWDKLSEYWRAYDDYKEMCRKQKLNCDGLPFCLCWPDSYKRAFFVSLAALIGWTIVLVLDLWRASQGANLGSFAIIKFLAWPTIAAFTGNCFFPDQYRSARQFYPNLLYFRAKSEKDLAKLEQALSVICEAVAPYREQKRLEEEARRRRLAEEKQRYLKCFRPLWAHLKDVAGLDAKDFDSERVDDKFSVLVPGKKDKGAEDSAPVELRYSYDEEGLQGLIDKIAEIEAEQTRETRRQELRAEAERILANNHP